MSKAPFCFYLAVVLILLAGSLELVNAQKTLEVKIDLVRESKDDIFLENEPVEANILVQNNSDSGKVVDIKGYVRSLAIGVPYTSDILSEHTTIEPGKAFEYRFSEQFISGAWAIDIRASEFNGTHYIDSDSRIVQFTVQPRDDAYTQQIARDNQTIAWTSIIAAVIGPAVAAIALILQWKSGKQVLTEMQMQGNRHKGNG